MKRCILLGGCGGSVNAYGRAAQACGFDLAHYEHDHPRRNDSADGALVIVMLGVSSHAQGVWARQVAPRAARVLWQQGASAARLRQLLEGERQAAAGAEVEQAEVREGGGKGGGRERMNNDGTRAGQRLRAREGACAGGGPMSQVRPYESFGAHLAALRRSKGLRLVDAATAAGIGRTARSGVVHLSAIECGKALPLPRTLAALARVYRVPLQDLVRRRREAKAAAQAAGLCFAPKGRRRQPKGIYKCSRCHQLGHNVQTCPNPRPKNCHAFGAPLSGARAGGAA